jgi:tetratricopeptide (TPR) repeat protein
VAADPQFAMGTYYLSAVTTPPENEKHLAKAVELSKNASDGERRFIEAMNVARANQGANVKDAIPALEKLGADYPGERLVQVILGQVYQGQNEPDKARIAFERAREIGPPSARVQAFLANDDLLKGDYDKARQTFLEVEKDAAEGRGAFRGALRARVQLPLPGPGGSRARRAQDLPRRVQGLGLGPGLPEVFIWNSIARINLENGRARRGDAGLRERLQERPRQQPAEDQKQVW